MKTHYLNYLGMRLAVDATVSSIYVFGERTGINIEIHRIGIIIAGYNEPFDEQFEELNNMFAEKTSEIRKYNESYSNGDMYDDIKELIIDKL